MHKLIRNRNFVLLWSGQMMSAIGTALHDLAMAWYVYALTGSTLATGASIISSFLPRALISPWAGLAADRLNRKAIIVQSDIFSGAAVMAMFLLARAGHLTLPLILTFTALLSISSAFIGPSASAAIQSILTEQEYQAANSLRQLRWRLATVIGAFLGGLLLRVFGLQALLGLNALSFWLSAWAESFIRLPQKPPAQAPSTQASPVRFKEAIGFIRGHPALLFLLIAVMVVANGLFMSLFVYMPALFSDVFAADSSAMGFYYSIEAGAAALTALFLMQRRLARPFLWIASMLAVEGLLLLGHGLVTTVFAAYGLAALLGVSTTVCVVCVMTVEQLVVPNEMMGRYQSLAALLGDGAMPIFTLLFGVLGVAMPVQTVVLAAGMLFLLTLLPIPWVFATEMRREKAHLAQH